MYQPHLSLPSHIDNLHYNEYYKNHLVHLLSTDLDFHDQDSQQVSHNFHSFPAKFPPQLPQKFITALTLHGDIVLDPMLGSGTTILEALLANRRGIGFDIDPLALRIAQVKVTSLDKSNIEQMTETILEQAQMVIQKDYDRLQTNLKKRWDEETKHFIDYWFAQETQVALSAILGEITKIEEPKIRAFFELVFSSIIITKSGGVSLALDLAHTRPHRAKLVFNKKGKVILGDPTTTHTSPRMKILTKTLRSPIDEFIKRVRHNIKGLPAANPSAPQPVIDFGKAQSLPLSDNSIDLIITSPPYASNAIDYMRAHKFALVWFGYSIADLRVRRKTYIGHDSTKDTCFEVLPSSVTNIVNTIGECDRKKGVVLYRYYSEMTQVLKEMFRILKPGKASIMVVGSSVMDNKDTETPECLAEIGRMIGFEIPKIGIRHLDRDRRMLPVGMTRNLTSQIQQRMHEEYVISFYKPKPLN